MGSTPPELSLDLNPPPPPPPTTTATYTSKSISVFLTEIATMGNISEKSSKLDEYVKRLEEEMKKIDAFKRELPLCMLLLNDAIVTLKEQSTTIHCVKKPLEEVEEEDDDDEENGDVVKEFIPLIRNCDEEEDVVVGVKMEKDCRDKMNWMSSAQLWSNNDCSNDEKQQKSVERNERGGGEEDDRSMSRSTTNESTFPLCKYKNGGGVGGGAFMPFKGFSSGFPVAKPTSSTRKEEKEIQPVSAFSLLTPPPGIKTITNMESNSVFFNSRSSGGHRTVPCSSATTTQQHQQPPRKQRRCWSPDLHRRFVGALQQLGGSQVATPKQIRELMKVDGLTNDEVKSHLQKYRLHTRRAPNSSTPANQQGVVHVLGGLWVSQDQYGTSKSNTSQSESPQGPLQLSGGGGGISTTGGDSMDGDDDEEDEKSESYSWKGHHQNKPSESRETDA